VARFETGERDTARERLRTLWGSEEDYEEPDEDFEEAVTETVSGPEAVPELMPGPREGQRETVQARALLEKAERLLEKIPAEDRADVEKLMTRVRTALTDRKWEQVTTACNELADTLFYLED